MWHSLFVVVVAVALTHIGATAKPTKSAPAAKCRRVQAGETAISIAKLSWRPTPPPAATPFPVSLPTPLQPPRHCAR